MVRPRRAGPIALVALVAVSTGTACGGDESPSTATLVVRNGRLWTGREDGSDPHTALAVVGERIAALGSDEDVAAWIGDDTRVIDAAGGLVTPGFIDSHVHFLEGGYRLTSVQLRDAATPEDFVARVAAFARTVPAGTWITGGDWDHENWGGELPRADWIDSVTVDHPVMVSRLDGHMVLANTAAMRAAGVDPETADVEGGEVVRDPGGHPTGVFKDNAITLVAHAAPPTGDEADDRALDAAMAYVAERGVTSVVHMGTFDDLDVFRRARAEGRLGTRITACTPLAEWERLAELVAREGRGDDWLRWGCVKGFVDGSLGSHTAAFFEPFTDTPGESGFFVNAEEDLEAWTTGADSAGLDVAIHAIGDRAISTLLDIFARVQVATSRSDRRFRIEHAQHIAPADLERFAALGVVASMQPYHAIDDGRWAERVIGAERIKTTYAFRALLDRDVTLAFGSDWFVAPPSPLEGLYAAVTRRTLDGANPDGWVPEQRITLEEGLQAYTVGAAYGNRTEDRLGRLAVGRLADLVVMDQDLFRIPPASLADARVTTTVVGGRVVY